MNQGNVTGVFKCVMDLPMTISTLLTVVCKTGKYVLWILANNVNCTSLKPTIVLS